MDLTGMATGQVGKVFYFRLMAYLPIFFASCMGVAAVTLAFANNWGPFDSVFPNNTLNLIDKP